MRDIPPFYYRLICPASIIVRDNSEGEENRDKQSIKEQLGPSLCAIVVDGCCGPLSWLINSSPLFSSSSCLLRSYWRLIIHAPRYNPWPTQWLSFTLEFKRRNELLLINAFFTTAPPFLSFSPPLSWALHERCMPLIIHEAAPSLSVRSTEELSRNVFECHARSETRNHDDCSGAGIANLSTPQILRFSDTINIGRGSPCKNFFGNCLDGTLILAFRTISGLLNRLQHDKGRASAVA